MITHLLTLYTEEYVTAGGEGGEVEDYATQHLTRKIKEQMSDRMTVKLADQRIGNFVFSNNMTEEEARARLYANTKKNEEDLKLKWAALHLRSLVMQLPKSRTPHPATVQNLKECSPQIPEQL